MWYSTKPSKETLDKIDELTRENANLKNQVKSLKQIIDDINSAVTACKPVIDFNTMRIFSIERNVNNNRPCTIIGFWEEEPVLSSDGEMIVKKDVHKEWYLYCNNERHAELIEEFKDWKTQNVK